MTLTWLVTVVAIGVGAAMRCWYLFHRPTSSDEAINGIMANQILHGHFSAFYWGQVYGGAEQYLMAARLAIFGNSTFLIPIVAIVLSVGSGLLTWRIALRLVPDPALAALAVAVSWVAPQTVPYNAAYAYGFRGLALFLGLLLVLLSLRILDGDDGPSMFALWGLAAGVAWWSSPEVIYFVVPAAIILMVAFVRDGESARGRRWIGRLGLGAILAVVGALPWIWANINSGFASLQTGKFTVPTGAPDYVGRVRVFFHYSLPILFSLRGGSGAWLWQRDFALLVFAVLALLLLVAGVLCIMGDWRYRAIAIGVAAFPFLVALSPATWFWGDGRYVGYVVPLIALVYMAGFAEAARRWAGRNEGRAHAGKVARRACMSGLVTILMVLSAANFNSYISPVSGFLNGWGDPDGATVQLLPKLEAQGIRYGYADYWVAYRLDYLSTGKLGLTVTGSDPDRWSALNNKVTHAASTSWVFASPTAVAQLQFPGITNLGPGGLSEQQFITDLRRLGIGYRIVTSGFIQAVVPDRPVSPAHVDV